MTHPDFGRLITAMATPFDQTGDVDFKEAIRLADHLYQTGTDTVLLAGTTGESPTLSHLEEHLLFKAIRDAFPSKRLMVGTGSNSTKTAIESTQNAQEIGADGTLQVVPYYNRPSQAGCIAHFEAIANSTSLPMILYNIPGRTGRNLEPESVAQLAKHPTIIGIKEAAGSIDQVKAIRAQTPSSFLIYSGDDGLTLDFMHEGAVGVISVASHFVGLDLQRMMTAFDNGEFQSARDIEARLTPLFEALFITSNPTPLKSGLNQIGFKVGDPRLPLIPATAEESQKITNVLTDLGLI